MPDNVHFAKHFDKLTDLYVRWSFSKKKSVQNVVFIRDPKTINVHLNKYENYSN